MLVGAGRASVRLFCFSAPDLSRRIPPFRIPRRRDVMHTTPKFDRVRVAAMAACAMLVATTIALVAAHEGGRIAACVNSHSGELRIVGSQNCPAGSYLLQWNERGEPAPWINMHLWLRNTSGRSPVRVSCRAGVALDPIHWRRRHPNRAGARRLRRAVDGRR